MNYLDLYSSYPDQTIAAAWDSQVKDVEQTPWLSNTLKGCSGELFTRFATCYAELRALPRGARRALQRRLARSSELAVVLPEYLQQGGRKLQYRMAWTLAGAALLLALGQSVATAATITVTRNDPNIVVDGQCSLIEAIVNANNDAATHADCAAGSGADVIVLPANANVILTNVFYSPQPTGLPPITGQITIAGNGAVIARDGSGSAFRLMTVRNSGDLTLQQVTLSGGHSIWRGGGLVNYGAATIVNSTISGNAATYGAGGVFNFGTLAVVNSTISGNDASGYSGGGIENWGTLTVANSTISQNLAGLGGGVSNFLGTGTIKNSTISGNTASGGGGLSNTAYCYFDCSAASLTIENSTISGNHANQGGGVSNVLDCYASSCPTATLNLNRSLIAGNQAAVAAEVENNSAVNANNFNLFGSSGNAGVVGFTPGPTDIVPAASLAQILGSLANNGGPTQTHALVAGSPAIDAGGPSGCRDSLGTLLLIEQRGFARHADGNNDGQIRCDIGAFEFGAESVPIPTPLGIGAATLATGEIGVSFTSDLMISGGFAPYLVSIAKGKLPSGLSLGNDGVISGTPAPTARSEKVTVRITDSLNESVTQTFTVNVLKALRIAGKFKTGRVGRDYSDSLKTRGGLGPFSWSITSGALPTGLNFNNATGALTGVPTEAGEFPLTAQATDASGGVDVENLTLKIR